MDIEKEKIAKALRIVQEEYGRLPDDACFIYYEKMEDILGIKVIVDPTIGELRLGNVSGKQAMCFEDFHISCYKEEE